MKNIVRVEAHLKLEVYVDSVESVLSKRIPTPITIDLTTFTDRKKQCKANLKDAPISVGIYTSAQCDVGLITNNQECITLS